MAEGAMAYVELDGAPGAPAAPAGTPSGALVSALASQQSASLAQSYPGGLPDLDFDATWLAEDTIAKALTASRLKPQGVKDSVSIAARRYLHAFTGVLTDATPHLDYTVLRRLAESNPVLQAVMNTLINQVASYFVRPKHPKAIGVRVAQKDRHRPLTAGAAKQIEYIEGILFRGGIPTEHPVTGQVAVWEGSRPGRPPKRKAPKLGQAVRQIVRDSLVLDQVCVAFEGSRVLGKTQRHPVMFIAPEDAGLARYTDRDLYHPRIRDDVGPGHVEFVLMDPMSQRFGIMKEFTWKDGAIGHRNPRTEFAAFGYGQSEVQQCLDCVLGVLYGLRANKEYFTDNHVPLGILNMIGNYSDKDLKALRLKFRQDVGMPGNFWEFPIITTPPGQGAGAEFVPMQARDRMDMIFRAYIEFCVAISAAVFQIAPEEFGFAGFGGPTSTVSEADPSSTLQHSQHKGLVPKVLWIADFYTEHVVERIDSDFELQIQGLESVWLIQEQQALARDQQLMVLGMTPNHIRALNDEPPLPDPINMALWRQVEEYFDTQDKWFPSPRERVRTMIAAYESLGGQMGSVYDAPIGSDAAMQLWMMEHQQDLMLQQQVLPAMLQGQVEGQQQEAADQRQFGHEQQMAGVSHEQQMAQLSAQGDQRRQEVEMKGGMDQRLAQQGHQQALDLAGLSEDQQLRQLLMQHAQQAELAGQDRQWQSGEKAMDREHQGQLETGKQDHELGKLGLEHGQAFALGEQGHEHALAEADAGHQHQLAEADAGHQHALDLGQEQHGQQLTEQEFAHYLQQVLSAMEAGQQVDMAALQHVLAVEAQQLQGEQQLMGQLAQGDQAHGLKSEELLLQNLLSMLSGEQGHAQKLEQGEEAHGQRLREGEAGHRQQLALTREKGQVDRGNQEAALFQQAMGGIPMAENAAGGLVPKGKVRLKVRKTQGR